VFNLTLNGGKHMIIYCTLCHSHHCHCNCLTCHHYLCQEGCVLASVCLSVGYCI